MYSSHAGWMATETGKISGVSDDCTTLVAELRYGVFIQLQLQLQRSATKTRNRYDMKTGHMQNLPERTLLQWEYHISEWKG